MKHLTIFSWGYWGWGNSVERFLECTAAVESSRGFKPPVFVDARISRSVRGVNVIKILTTERAGLPDSDPRKRVFTDEEIAAIIDEARKSGIYVAAHAHGDEGAYAAVKAGVRSIEHRTYLSEQTLALMKERGTYFVPTIATVVDLIEPGGDYDNAILAIRGRQMLPRLREASAKAWKMGSNWSPGPTPATVRNRVAGCRTR